MVKEIEPIYYEKTTAIKERNQIVDKVNEIIDEVNTIDDTLKGDKGDTGPEGPRGPIGPKGEKGDKGDKGDQGERGYTGPRGFIGARGYKGIQGEKGDIGPQGEKGDKGDKGDDGVSDIPGPKGDQGDIGPQGEKGDKGDKGEQGPPGMIENVTYESIQGLPDMLDTLDSSISTHANNKSNPHGVTKAQIGLSNVNNTSDLAKPISTATQTALDEKADITYVDMEIANIPEVDISGKQDKLTFDNTPVAGSDNPVKSGGIYDALQAITFEIATEEDAIGGTDNTTLMTPLRVDQAFNEKFKVIDGVLNVFENGEWVQYEPK